jgi:penicillin-binding protein 1C
MLARLFRIVKAITARRWLVRVIATLFIGLTVLGSVADRWLFPLPVEKLERPHSYFVYSRNGHLLNAFASEDRFWRKPVALDSISPTLVKVVLSCEDQWFYYHPGVNPVSLVAAAYDNIKAGKVVRGGSTITMQIARMMEPKSRTIGSKLVEILRAFQLELHYSKAELLQIYFNLVPYGGNIEGVGAATHFYFGKQPARLSLSEAAILAAIPVSPNSFRPDANPEACRKRRDEILTRLLKNEVISRDEFDQAIAEEMPVRRAHGYPYDY